MKFIINAAYGGYCVPQQVWQILGCGPYDDWANVRTDPYFVEWVETHRGQTDLRVVEIPNEATDWELNEYDGLESIIAVVDGKIVHIR